MQLISSIHIPNNRNAVIELLHGDLSAIPPEHAVDILVVSAFPGDYTPVDGSLMGSLAHKGLSIRDLATYKKLDLRTQLGCWLSEPLCKEQQQQFNIGSVLCFEPRTQSNAPEEVVGNIFRCINSIAFDDEHNSIAMPVIATGNQRVSIQTMLPALLETTIFWLQNGLPLNAVKLVVYSAGQLAVATALFEETKQRLEQKEAPAPAKTKTNRGFAPQPPAHMAPSAGETTPPVSYDFFISYAHKHTGLVNSFVESLLKANQQLNIFYDRTSIPPGGLWIRQISDAIQKAKRVLILLSPDYTNSPVCWDEFQCAKLMEYNNKKQLIQTLYLYNDAALPPIMGIYSWIDCREGDLQKLQEATGMLLN